MVGPHDADQLVGAQPTRDIVVVRAGVGNDTQIGAAPHHGIGNAVIADAYVVDVGREIGLTDELLEPRCGVVEVEGHPNRRPSG